MNEDFNTQALRMARDLGEEAAARQILIAVLESVAGLPQKERGPAASVAMRKQIIDDVGGYHSRLLMHIEKVAASVQEMIDRREVGK